MPFASEARSGPGQLTTEHAIEYLDNGVRPDQRPFRFDLYFGAARTIAEEQSVEAVPILKHLLAVGLSDIQQSDLDIEAGVILPMRSWDDWDRQAHCLHDWLRLDCARALGKITGESQGPFLRELLARWEPVARSDKDFDPARSTVVDLVLEICSQLARDNDPAGIDTAINLLDSSQLKRSIFVADQLVALTGKPIGPNHDDTPTTASDEILKWKTWWHDHRASFVALESDGRFSDKTPCLPPSTLADHLRLSVDAPCAYGYESSRWLEENTDALMREFCTVIADTTAHPVARAQALFRFVDRSNHEEGLHAIQQILMNPADLESSAIASAVSEIISDKYFEERIAIADQLLRSDPSATREAIIIAGSRPEALDLFAGKFEGMPTADRRMAFTLMMRRERLPISVIESALSGSEYSLASIALLACEDPGLVSRLSPTAQVRLASWRNDPLCLFQTIRDRRPTSDDPGQASRVLRAIDPNNPASAYVCARLVEWKFKTTEDLAKYSTFRTSAFKKLLDTVAAYRVSRGRTAPLPAYDL